MNVGSSLSKLLIEPRAQFERAEQRHHARLLAALLVVIAPAGLVAATVQWLLHPEFATTYLMVLPAIGALAVAYMLTRFGHYRLGTGLTCAAATLACYGIMWVSPDDMAVFLYLLIPVVLATLLLSPRTATVSGILVVGGAAVILLLRPPPGIGINETGSILALAILTAVLLVSAQQRNHMEQIRQARLAESERNFRAVASGARDGLVVISASGEILFTNRTVSEMLGYEPAGFLAVAPGDHIHPDDRARLMGILSQRLAGEPAPELYQARLLHRDGHTVPVEISAAIVSWGGQTASMAFARDITSRKRTEQALRNKERLLSEAQRMGRIGSWDWDIADNALTWSDEVYRILGRRPGEGNTGHQAFLECVARDDREKVKEAVDAALAGRAPYEVEHRVVLPDGTVRHVHERAEVKYDDRGAAARMTGYLQDITERKRMEMALARTNAELERRVAERTAAARASERWYRTLVDTIPYGVDETDLTGAIVYCNPARCEMLGYEHSELIGRKIPELSADPVEQRRNRPSRLRALAQHQPAPEPVLTQYRRKDGAIIDVQIDWNYKRDTQGTVIGFVSVFSDLTEQRRILAALHESETLLRDLAENIEQVFYVRDLEQRQMLYVSSAYERIWGRPLSAIYDDPTDFLKVVHPDDYARVHSAMEQNGEGVYFNEEYRILRDDGETRWIHARAFPIHDDQGEVHRIAGLAQDITARKQAQQAVEDSREQLRQLALHQEADREALRTRIAREIHDELGQTLTAFHLDLHWLNRNRAHPEKIGTKTQEMQHSVSGLIKAVQKISSELRPIILDDLGLDAACAWYIDQFEEKSGLACQRSIELDPGTIPEDYAITLYRILQEALTNILRHARATRTTVELRHEDDHLKLTVTDDGVGISQASIQRNDAFGIMSMRERVHALQGELDIVQGREGGTHVHVVLPIGQSKEFLSSVPT